MMKKNKKKSFEVKARYCLIVAFSIYIIGGLAIKSIESSMNVQQQIVEDKIQTLKSDIDGLDIERQNMTSFAHLNDVATGQGFSYSHNDVTAYVTSE